MGQNYLSSIISRHPDSYILMIRSPVCKFLILRVESTLGEVYCSVLNSLLLNYPCHTLCLDNSVDNSNVLMINLMSLIYNILATINVICSQSRDCLRVCVDRLYYKKSSGCDYILKDSCHLIYIIFYFFQIRVTFYYHVLLFGHMIFCAYQHHSCISDSQTRDYEMIFPITSTLMVTFKVKCKPTFSVNLIPCQVKYDLKFTTNQHLLACDIEMFKELCFTFQGYTSKPQHN